jgi:[methyl-Co(III) methanol-specific corrinoid protein]:coenzyme M methyltransferase
MSRQAFIQAIQHQPAPGRVMVGSGTSIVSQELMQAAGANFPAGHTDPQAMFRLALAGHTILGFDVVMPLFSVCHEAAGLGSRVNWGSTDSMPESGRAIFSNAADIKIPVGFLTRPGCAVPLQALGLLQAELNGAAAVCGKVMGPWTLAYHTFGLEEFLIKTITETDEVRRILEGLLPATLQFARAQIEAGADCLLLADHATRDLCSPKTYEKFLMEIHAFLVKEIKAPLILHICGDTRDRIGMIQRTGMACFHWDTKSGPAAEVRKLAGDRMALMGGVNNIRLLQGTPEEVSGMVRQAVEAGIDVVGPECAIPLATPLKNLLAITRKPSNLKME